MSGGIGPVNSPSQKYWLGNTHGDAWRAADSHVGGINAQTGTTYTIQPSDQGKLITFNNGGAVAVTLPAPGGVGFGANSKWGILNLGAGTVTLTPASGTINGGANKTYAQGVGGNLTTDATNYFAF